MGGRVQARRTFGVLDLAVERPIQRSNEDFCDGFEEALRSSHGLKRMNAVPL